MTREERAPQTMPRVLRVVLSRKIVVKKLVVTREQESGIGMASRFLNMEFVSQRPMMFSGSFVFDDKVKLKGGQPDFDFVRVENVRARMSCVRRKNKVPLRPESTKMRERAMKM